jgi:uncharacterized protein YrrD
MATDMKEECGSELSAGDIIIAHDDFALVLGVSKNGWPEEWVWLACGYHALALNMPQEFIKDLFEGRAILRPDGQVLLCKRDRDGWNEQALAWWREAEAEATRETRVSEATTGSRQAANWSVDNAGTTDPSS